MALHPDQLIRRLKLRQLNALVAVAQWGSMARAAEHLAVSQPVVSKAIADLENILGVRLLDRNPHGVEPTLYGRALLKRSVAIFNDLSSSVSELEFLADPTAGELRVGSTDPMMAGLLCAVVDQLSRQYPRLALTITLGEPPDLQDRQLREHEIDLMLGRLPSARPAADTKVDVLFDEQARVVAGLRNRWTSRRKIKLAELMKEPWCLPPPESFPGRLIAKIFEAHGLDVPRANVIVLSVQMQCALLATGRFLTILPATMLYFSARRLALKVLPVDLPIQGWPIGIITLKDRTLNPATRVFIDCAREVSRPLVKKNEVPS
jgi:DNA-binding transcriptional LysR family regulator